MKQIASTVRTGVATALAMMLAPVPSVADGTAEEVFAAMTEAAIVGTLRGDAAARGTLGMLLDLPAPWNELVIRTVERSTVIDAVTQRAASGPRNDRIANDALLRRIAELQGASYRDTAVQARADGEAIIVDLGDQSTRWLLVDAGAGDPHELFVESAECTPTVTAFAGSKNLPAAPLAGQARFSARLATVPVDGMVALRVERGDCENESVRLALALDRPREVLGANGSTTPSGRRERARLPVDRVVVTQLARQRAEHLVLPTEPGYVYEVDAAPVTAGVDPALILADPLDSAAVAAADDDSGWELGARLEAIVGTGREERLALMRATDAQGEVAVYVRRRLAVDVRVDLDNSVQISDRDATWLRAELDAGHWDLRIHGASESLDAAMVVHDAVTGAVIEANDDESDEILNPRVQLTLDKPTVVLIQLLSVGGDGTATLGIRPAGKASLEDVSPKKPRASELST